MITEKVRQSPAALWAEARKSAALYYQKLSFREKGLLALMVLVFAGWLVYQGSLKVASKFAEQNQRLESVESLRAALPYRLADHAELQARKDAVEKAYQKVEISEGMLTYLETLLNGKSSIQRPFEIDDKQPKAFGGKYEQMQFLVKFGITDYAELINLLKELTQGDKPLIIKSISVKKYVGGRQLRVELDLTGVRKIEVS